MARGAIFAEGRESGHKISKTRAKKDESDPDDDCSNHLRRRKRSRKASLNRA